MAGYTGSKDFPITKGAFQTVFKGGDNFDGDGFVSKLNAEGSTLFYSSYLGGTGHDYAAAIAVDSKGSAYIAGETTSTDFPTKRAYQKQNKGERDAFVTSLLLPRSLILLPVQTLGAGEATTGTVLLDSTATTDTIVSLGSDSTIVSLPSSVIVPKGANSVNFNVVTSSSLYDTEVHLTTTPTSLLSYTPLLVIAPRTLTALKAPSALTSGAGGIGIVSLDIPAPETGIVVNLSSDNPTLTVPSSVTITQFRNSTDFVISSDPVSVDTKANITASYNGVTLKKAVEIQIPRTLSALQTPSALAFGTAGVGTVSLDIPAPSTGIVVTLSSDNTALKLPKRVTIPALKSSAEFTLTAGNVTADTTVTVSATYKGVTLKKSVKIQAAVVISVIVSPMSVKGGNTVTGMVTVAGIVPATGLIVNLRSDQAQATVPAKLTIPAGKSSASFTIMTSTVTSKMNAHIKARYGVTQAQATLTIKP